MSHLELFSQGNEAYVDEDYNLALQRYSAAIDLDGSNSGYFVKRATTYIRLGLYNDAYTDSNKAIELDANNIKAHLRRGESLYHQDKYEEAKTAFEAGLSIDVNSQDIQNWVEKCKAKLPLSTDNKTPEIDNVDTEQNKTKSSGTESGTEVHKTSDEEAKEAVSTDEPETPVTPLVRWDWYQNDKFVTITLMVKQCKADNVNISYQQNHVGGSVGIPSGATYNLDIHLAHPIDITQCKTRVLQTKIEVKLKKKDAIHWAVLERDKVISDVKTIPSDPQSAKSGIDDAVHQYPSSRHVVKDWDRLAADISKNDEDKEEGEAALNALFQKIYGEGGDQVKKAMNKSFVESGGTVLSTNWDEVGKSSVERKPPDGMEWKKWEN